MKPFRFLKLQIGLPICLVFLLTIGQTVSVEDCPFIEKLNSPVNILHEYTRFLFEVMNPQLDEVSIRLIKHAKIPNSALHRFFFELKYPKNRMKFIGTEAAFNEQAGRYVITKHLQSYDLEDLKKFFDDQKLSLNDGVFCENLKQNFIRYFYAHNYVQSVLIDNYDILSKEYSIDSRSEVKEHDNSAHSQQKESNQNHYMNSRFNHSAQSEKEMELEAKRERERELIKEKERQQELERERQRAIELEKEKEREKEREREREKERERERERERMNATKVHEHQFKHSLSAQHGSLSGRLSGHNSVGSNPFEGLLTYENISADSREQAAGDANIGNRYGLQEQGSSAARQHTMNHSSGSVQDYNHQARNKVQQDRLEMQGNQNTSGHQNGVSINSGSSHSGQQNSQQSLNGMQLADYLAKLKSTLSTVDYNKSAQSGAVIIDANRKQNVRPIQGVIRPTEYYFQQLSGFKQSHSGQSNTEVRATRLLNEQNCHKSRKNKRTKNTSKKRKSNKSTRLLGHQNHKPRYHIQDHHGHGHTANHHKRN